MSIISFGLAGNVLGEAGIANLVARAASSSWVHTICLRLSCFESIPRMRCLSFSQRYE